MKALVALLAVSGLAGEPERTTGRLLVASADPGARVVTVADPSGVTRVLRVRGEAERTLPRLRPGDVVALSVGPEPGVASGPEVVLDIHTFSTTSPRAAEPHDGLRELKIAAAELATRADELDRDWSAFRETCLRAPGLPPERGREWVRSVDAALPISGDETCRRAHEELARRVRKFQKDVGLVSVEARRAGVSPLQIRAALERHDIEP